MAKCGKFQPVPPGSISMVVENDPSSESKLDSTYFNFQGLQPLFRGGRPSPNSLQVRLIRKSPSNSEHCRLLRLSLPTAPSLPLQELRHRHHRRRPRQHHHRHRRSPDMWFWAKWTKINAGSEVNLWWQVCSLGFMVSRKFQVPLVPLGALIDEALWVLHRPSTSLCLQPPPAVGYQIAPHWESEQRTVILILRQISLTIYSSCGTVQ